jgi:Spy/CpxP family protein refolding chaperone
METAASVGPASVLGKEIAVRKSLLSLAFLLALAVPIAAQAPPPLGGPPPEYVLKEVLGLSDQQLASFRDLAQARASAADALRRQLEDRQRALSHALSSPTPDPGAVGALVISTTSLQKQAGQIEAGFQNGFLGLLSDEQKSKLGFIQSVEAALRAAGALHQLGL